MIFSLIVLTGCIDADRTIYCKEIGYHSWRFEEPKFGVEDYDFYCEVGVDPQNNLEGLPNYDSKFIPDSVFKAWRYCKEYDCCNCSSCCE